METLMETFRKRFHRVKYNIIETAITLVKFEINIMKYLFHILEKRMYIYLDFSLDYQDEINSLLYRG